MSGFKNIQVLLSADAGNLKRVLAQSSRDVDGFAKSVLASNKSLSAGKVAMLGAAAAATSVALGLAYAASKAIEFDKNMRNVNSLSHMSEGAFKALEDQVISLSKVLPQSAADLSAGLYDIASSGFQGADGLKVLQAAAAAASAGLTTTANSAQAITAVLNAYGLQAKDAADVSDTLFQTVNLGVINFESLSGVIGDVVGTAAAAKVSIDQVGSAIATMTLTGITGSEAGTSLNRVLQSLVQPSDTLAILYHKLGYESGASALEQKGLQGVMEDVRQATGGNIEVMLKLFPEIRAARGALALMANEGQNYAKVSAQISDKEARRGATMRTLDEQMKATANQAALFKNGIDAIAISVGVKLLPVLNGLMDAATSTVSSFEDAAAVLADKLQPAFEAISQIGSDVWHILAELGKAVEPVIKAIGGLAAGAVIASLNALATVLSKVTGYLSDNIPIVYMLAAAYGASLVPMLVKTVMFNAQMAGWIIKNTISMAAARGGVMALAASLMTLASAETVATLGLTLIVGAIAAGVTGLDEAQRSAEEFANSFTDGMNKMDPEDVQKRLVKISDAFKEASDSANIYFGGDSGWSDFVGQMKAGWELITPLDNTAADATARMEELRKKEQELQTQQTNLAGNLKFFTAAFGMTEEQVKSLADAAGVDLTGSIDDVRGAMYTFYDSTHGASAAQQELIKQLGVLATTAGDAGSRVDALKASLDALLGVPMDLEKATSDYEAALDNLTDSLIKNKGNTDLNTEAGRASREAIRGTVSALEDQLTAMAQSGKSSDEMSAALKKGIYDIYAQGEAAGFSKEKMEKLLKAYGLTPDKVETIVRAAGTDAAATDIAAVQAEIDKLTGKTVDVKVRTTGIVVVGGQTFAKLPTGKLVPFADGGVLPHQATIARDGANLVQWAEPGTGGEAFIPLAGHKRARSTKILGDVASSFGYGLTKFADGGYYNDSDYAKRVAAARREAAARNGTSTRTRTRSTSSHSSTRSSRSSSSAGTEYNAPEYNFSLEGVASMTEGAAKKAPTLADYQKTLNAQIKAQTKWKSDLTRISRVAGADVTSELKKMGERGVQIVAAMAKGSDKEIKAMAASLKKLGPTAKEAMKDFADALHGEAGTNKQFAADLLKITKMGHPDIAQQLLSIGPEQGASIARAIASGQATAAQIKQISADLKTNAAASSPDFADALALASILTNSSKPLGINGLAGASGMDLAHVMAVISKYNNDVFKPLGAKDAQVAADLALIAAGQQPSGMSRGGIIGGNATGLHYRWAEKGTGGESLIPLGINNRQRSIDLWRETGRLLGQKPVHGGGGTINNIAPGAVAVSLQVDGSSMSPAEVQAVATAAVNQGLDRLTTKLRGGAGRG